MKLVRVNFFMRSVVVNARGGGGNGGGGGGGRGEEEKKISFRFSVLTFLPFEFLVLSKRFFSFFTEYLDSRPND